MQEKLEECRALLGDAPICDDDFNSEPEWVADIGTGEMMRYWQGVLGAKRRKPLENAMRASRVFLNDMVTVGDLFFKGSLC